MRDQQIAAIRQKCIEANPEIAGEQTSYTCPTCGGDGDIEIAHDHLTGRKQYESCNACKGGGLIFEREARPIRLANVLLAWNESDLPRSSASRRINLVRIADRWNLRTDDLTQQSDETVSFIYQLLQDK